jgi:putative membrane protein
MDGPTEMRQRAALSDYLAAERTLLAWIRTGLALMGFGFVVARFGLFLQQLQATQRATAARPYGLSLWFGTALIAVGVIVNVFAGWHHLRLVRELDRGRTEHSRPSTEVVALAFFLALVGLAMAIYLVSVRRFTGSQLENSTETSMTLSKGEGVINLASYFPVQNGASGRLSRAQEAMRRLCTIKVHVCISPLHGVEQCVGLRWAVGPAGVPC